MEYTYEVDEQNKVTITQTGTDGVVAFRSTLNQRNSPIDGAPWTKEEAEQWAETTIQAMKDNNDTFSTLNYNLEA
jgi:phospholipase C